MMTSPYHINSKFRSSLLKVPNKYLGSKNLLYLFDGSYLPKVTSRSTLNKRYISCQTHPINMVSGSWKKNTSQQGFMGGGISYFNQDNIYPNYFFKFAMQFSYSYDQSNNLRDIHQQNSKHKEFISQIYSIDVPTLLILVTTLFQCVLSPYYYSNKISCNKWKQMENVEYQLRTVKAV